MIRYLHVFETDTIAVYNRNRRSTAFLAFKHTAATRPQQLGARLRSSRYNCQENLGQQLFGVLTAHQYIPRTIVIPLNFTPYSSLAPEKLGRRYRLIQKRHSDAPCCNLNSTLVVSHEPHAATRT